MWIAVLLAVASSWLDQPIVKWNRFGGGVPRAPKAEGSTDRRCLDQIRTPASRPEKAVAKAGWKLYGESSTEGATTVLLALSGFDGMCRPLGYQAFVYSGSKFVGTLSPIPMNSRSDGSLS